MTLEMSDFKQHFQKRRILKSQNDHPKKPAKKQLIIDPDHPDPCRSYPNLGFSRHVWRGFRVDLAVLGRTSADARCDMVQLCKKSELASNELFVRIYMNLFIYPSIFHLSIHTVIIDDHCLSLSLSVTMCLPTNFQYFSCQPAFFLSVRWSAFLFFEWCSNQHFARQIAQFLPPSLSLSGMCI